MAKKSKTVSAVEEQKADLIANQNRLQQLTQALQNVEAQRQNLITEINAARGVSQYIFNKLPAGVQAEFQPQPQQPATESDDSQE